MGWVCMALQWRHNERHSVSNHQPLDCLLRRLFRRASKKASKLRVTGLCEEKPPVSGGFPSQKASNAKNVYVWWRHHGQDNSFVTLFMQNKWQAIIWTNDQISHWGLFKPSVNFSINKLKLNGRFTREWWTFIIISGYLKWLSVWF